MSTTTATLEATMAEHIDSIWRGVTGGFGEHQLADNLAEAIRDLAALEAGRLTPQRVVGRHVRRPKTLAREYLNGRITALTRALATRGWSESVNVSNAAHRIRTDSKGNRSHYDCVCEEWRAHGVAHDPADEAVARAQAMSAARLVAVA